MVLLNSYGKNIEIPDVDNLDFNMLKENSKIIDMINTEFGSDNDNFDVSTYKEFEINKLPKHNIYIYFKPITYGNELKLCGALFWFNQLDNEPCYVGIGFYSFNDYQNDIMSQILANENNINLVKDVTDICGENFVKHIDNIKEKYDLANRDMYSFNKNEYLLRKQKQDSRMTFKFFSEIRDMPNVSHTRYTKQNEIFFSYYKGSKEYKVKVYVFDNAIWYRGFEFHYTTLFMDSIDKNIDKVYSFNPKDMYSFYNPKYGKSIINYHNSNDVCDL